MRNLSEFKTQLLVILGVAATVSLGGCMTTAMVVHEVQLRAKAHEFEDAAAERVHQSPDLYMALNEAAWSWVKAELQCEKAELERKCRPQPGGSPEQIAAWTDYERAGEVKNAYERLCGPRLGYDVCDNAFRSETRRDRNSGYTYMSWKEPRVPTWAASQASSMVQEKRKQ